MARRNAQDLAAKVEHARTVAKSRHIQKFSTAPVLPAVIADPPAAALPASPVLSNAAATQHAALARLAARASAAHDAQAEQRPVQSRRRDHIPTTQLGRYAAMAASVAILGGYVWLQNYPKLSLHSAASKAGLSVTMPGYVPSSYALTSTNTAPGLVTLNFTSPSQPGTLTVAQARTTWDSRSLLDNYVSHRSNDYTAVEGQGLTVYLYGQNQAAWVNHGVQYAIEGTSRLSREQILKIVYSL